MSIPTEIDPFALDDEGSAATPGSSSPREPEPKDSPWSIAASRALPAAASLLAKPPEPSKVAKAAETFRLASPAPPPTALAPQAPGAAARAREAYEHARQAAAHIEVEPFHAPPRIDPDKLDALAKVAGEVVLDSALGTIALVAEPTGRTDRTELTFEEAATLRTLVDAFPGSRIIGLRSAAQRANDNASQKDGHGEGAPSEARDSARAGAPSHEQRWTGTRCSACGDPQYETPSGVTCANGHGNAEPAGDAAEFESDAIDPFAFGGNTKIENAAPADAAPSKTNTLETEPDPFALD